MYFAVIILAVIKVYTVMAVDLDVIDCGVDHDTEVTEGEVELYQYPWVGVLYYAFFGEVGESRATTTVVLIHAEFVIAPAADIGPMPKHNFRKYTRVLLGEGWNRSGRRVRNYVIHPEYGETYNTIALVQLKDPVRDKSIRPLCPPPQMLKNPTFYVVKMKDDFENLEKEVINVMHIPGKMCKEFYVAANLYSKKMRPPHVACAVSLRSQNVCVWNAGAALVSRDVWGRWQLLGLGVRGPGCSAPSRYLDMMSYYPWVEDSLAKFKRLTISRINKQKFVLRTDAGIGPNDGFYQRFGACDEEEKQNLVFREAIVLRTDNNQYQFLTYNMTLRDNVEFSCLTLELVNASAVSEMKISHMCTRTSYGAPCYSYKGSSFDISVYLMFSDSCLFEMYAWGFEKEMKLIDIHEWKWEEGTYYPDFTLRMVEYRGPTFMTDFGYEPLDLGMWLPEYDLYTTTEFLNTTSTVRTPSTLPTESTTTKKTTTTSTTTTPRTKRSYRTRTRTTRTTTIPTITTKKLTTTTAAGG